MKFVTCKTEKKYLFSFLPPKSSPRSDRQIKAIKPPFCFSDARSSWISIVSRLSSRPCPLICSHMDLKESILFTSYGLAYHFQHSVQNMEGHGIICAQGGGDSFI